MKKAEFITVLDNCISKMMAGSSLQAVIAEQPALTPVLQPLLQAVALCLAQPAAGDLLPGAQERSRAAFLNRAAQIKKQGVAYAGSSRRPSFALGLLASLFVFAFAFLATGLVSATSLPGDWLYPLKLEIERAGQVFVFDQASRLEQTLKFDLRRAEEAHKLISLGRGENVHFGGVLFCTHGPDGQPVWKVDGVALDFDQACDLHPEDVEGTFVELDGITQPGGLVAVERLERKTFSIAGKITSLGDGFVDVDALRVYLPAGFSLAQPPKVGSQVAAAVFQDAEGRWVLLSVQPEDSPLSLVFPPQQDAPGASRLIEDDDDARESPQTEPAPADDNDADMDSGASVVSSSQPAGSNETENEENDCQPDLESEESDSANSE